MNRNSLDDCQPLDGPDEFVRLLLALGFINAGLSAVPLISSVRIVPVIYNASMFVLFALLGVTLALTVQRTNWARTEQVAFVVRRLIDVGTTSLASASFAQQLRDEWRWIILAFPLGIYCIQIGALPSSFESRWKWRAFM